MKKAKKCGSLYAINKKKVIKISNKSFADVDGIHRNRLLDKEAIFDRKKNIYLGDKKTLQFLHVDVLHMLNNFFLVCTEEQGVPEKAAYFGVLPIISTYSKIGKILSELFSLIFF